MNYGDLAKWRKWAPFTIAGFCLAPYFWVAIPRSELGTATSAVVPVIAAVVAFFYVALDVRGPLWHNEIATYLGPDIKRTLLRMAPRDLEITPAEREMLSQEEIFRQLRGIFWEAVDNDEQLKQQKQFFYANGITYTTTIDVFVICSIAAAFYLGGYFVSREPYYVYVCVFLLLVSLVSRFLALPRVRRGHQALSREQLEVLERTKKAFVENRFRELVQEKRQQGLLGSSPSSDA